MYSTDGGEPLAESDEGELLLSLLSATNALVEAGSREEVAEVAVDAATSVLGLDVSGVHLVADGGEVLEPVAVADRPAELLGREALVYERGENIVWETFEAGETTVVPDLDTVRDRLPNPETPVASALVVPVDGHGVFISTSLEEREFSQAEVRAAELLAAATATALDRVETERKLRRQNERLQQLAGVISHDLGSPLAVARGWTEMARDAEDPTEALDRVDAALQRVSTLVDDLVSLARTGAADSTRTPTDLGAAAAEAWSNAVEDSDATVVVADGLATVDAVRPLVDQLFENLFANAVDHGTADGAEGRPAGVTVRVGPLDDGGFYVEDDGPGIPADQRDRVFDHGFTTGTGTGFGLAIVDAVADAHDWTVSVTEADGGGARFEVSF